MASETKIPKATKVDASKVPSGPTPMHFNAKLGRDVIKSPFGTGALKSQKNST